MHLLLRTLLLLITSRKRSKVSVFDETSLPLRALVTDIDIAMIVNNGMYLSLCDLGRFDLMVRSGGWDVMRDKGWTPVVQAETITFRKSIRLHQKFTLETKIIGVDEKCIYFEQRFVSDGELYVRAFMATRIISKNGPVEMDEIFEAMGVEVPADLVLPEFLHSWREQTALPSARKPAPHSWADSHLGKYLPSPLRSGE
ncbi:acyl-CoA thioesterase [Neomicrococcus lactis]|uniref:acyl-CoA thioesterase n=1 Tax=Neomicrococcus lactis TaxID=732241 RepID=UPI002301B52A|nr:acyl-CoA thioesterase [Neomicrococcus lactis]